MRRFALIFGIVALVVIFAFVIALILWASVEKEDKSAPRWNKTEQLAERPNMMIDES